MKVLVVGSGAREHALVWKCVQSDLVERVYCAPGNGGTGGMARNIGIGAADVVRLVDFAKRERLGLIILGPEAAVDAGVGDALRHAGFDVFGPNRDAGRIESSKSFAKGLMRRAQIPTADFDVFTRPAPAKEWARARDGQVAVKADGLARGKGVIVCESVEASDRAIDAVLVEQRFGRSGATIVVEERLEGPELSVHAVTDGTDVIALAPARDYKRAGEGDRGANTGGMGAYSPPKGVGEALVQEEIALRTEKPQYDMTPHGPGLAKSAAALRGGRDLGLKDIAKKAAMAAEAAAIMPASAAALTAAAFVSWAATANPFLTRFFAIRTRGDSKENCAFSPSMYPLATFSASARSISAPADPAAPKARRANCSFAEAWRALRWMSSLANERISSLLSSKNRKWPLPLMPRAGSQTRSASAPHARSRSTVDGSRSRLPAQVRRQS